MNQSPYDRIPIIVSGLEKLTARPIQFQYDNDGNPILATNYETTCPSCGNMIVFLSSEIIKRNNENCIDCKNCKRPGKPDVKLDDLNLINVKISGQDINVGSGRLAPICPFIDPIAVGDFDPYKVNGFREVDDTEEVGEVADDEIEKLVG